jgi:hypothetical protein
MGHQIFRFVENGATRATLRAPLDCPAETLRWAQKEIQRDLQTYADAPPPSYLQQARALGRTVSEAVDARVRARVYREPTKAYREHLIDVLHDDPELAAAYRDGV